MAIYYVRNGGNDSYTGLSDAQAWATVARVNSFSFSTGDDVYFKCGDTWAGTYVFVDWNGTSENRVIIGAYYDDGIIGVSGEKPILDGEDTEPVDNYDGMITIENREYITVENIHVKRSAGYGIWTYESSNILIDDVYIKRTYMQGNYFKDSSYCVLQYSDISETCRYGNGAVVAFWGSDHVDILHNVLHETSNDQIVMNSGREGINFLHSDYSTAIGNIIYDCRGMGIYFDHTQNALAEYNLIYYTGDTDYWRNANHAGAGIVITDEEAQGPTHLSSDIVIKNNLIANCGDGIVTWSGELNDNDPALVNVSIINNIVVLPYSTDNSERSLEIGVSSRHSNSDIKNNIFWQTSNSIAYVQSTAEITFSNNLWSQAQGSVDTDAQGANDIYGELPDIFKTIGWSNIIPGSLDGSEFVLQNGSPAIDAGVNLGVDYDEGIDPSSTWPDSISLLDQDDYGSGWEIGAFVYAETLTTTAPTTTLTTFTPTTQIPTTIGPTTMASTTIVPTTSIPTTTFTTAAPTTLGPTTVGPTTSAPTTLTPTSLAPTTTLTTPPPPTTPPPHNPDLDTIFNCKANNYAGFLFVETSIGGVSLNASYGLADLELFVETSITGEVPCAGLYVLNDLELFIDTSIEGWGVANDQKKNWVGWSKIGEASFALDLTNDAGFRPMDWPGYVYQVRKLDKNVIIYGSGGVTAAYPVSSPMPTFGFKNMINVGVKNKTAVCGDEHIHFCIDTLGCLYKISTDGITRLGYEEFLLPLINPTMTWDVAKRRLYISDESVGYVYNEDILTGGYANLTGLYRVKENLIAVSPDTLITEPVEICTDIIDFKRRGLKSIESMQFDAISEVPLFAAIDYRYRKKDEFRTTQWSQLNNEGVAHVRTAGVEFRIRLKGLDHGTFDFSYISVQFKFIDQRFTRDPKGELDVY